MLALKKKRETEAKQAAEAAAAAAAEAKDNGGGGEAMQVESVEKVSLLGIGGKKKSKNGGPEAKVKKRTPGEIRIQKGTFSVLQGAVVATDRHIPHLHIPLGSSLTHCCCCCCCCFVVVSRHCRARLGQGCDHFVPQPERPHQL
jgi:hypothetical protein